MSAAAETLRRAAAVMKDYGFIHAAIAEGLVREAELIDAGEITPADVPESMDLANAYLEPYDDEETP